jgi:DNA-binding NtrC family response regulator
VRRSIFLVDRDEAFGQALQQVLGTEYSLRHEPSLSGARARFDTEYIDCVLLNLDPPGAEDPAFRPLELLRAAAERTVPLPVITYSWEARGRRAMAAFQEGAFDTLDQPLDVQQLKFVLERACRRVALVRELSEAQRLLETTRIEGLLGNSKTMDKVTELIRKVAEVLTTVLIMGESGTGKGVAAQAIHRLSERRNKPFVAFSVCTFPDSLIEDELFGHERGAFTNAGQMRRGRFEEANGGTIFIDEIGDLALPLQSKLLRVLQERTVERLGSNISRPVDVRVICATNRNLEKMVEEGTFREDLYFRISVVKIQLPALRQRKEDIPVLAEHFLRMFAMAHNKKARAFTPGFATALTRHDWPGNVRELQNVIERSVVLANGNEHLGVNDLPEELRELTISEDASAGSFHEALQDFKKELVRSALRANGGNKLKAAGELGISRCYLHRMLHQFGLVEKDASQENDGLSNDEETRQTEPNSASPGGAEMLEVS